MKVSELRAGQGKIDIEVKVKSKQEPRVMQKYGRELKVANAVVADDSGEISMSLWNAEADAVQIGDVVKVMNGYVSEFNGEKQLTAGKFGKLEVVKSASGAVSDNAEAKPVEEKSLPAVGMKHQKKEDAQSDIGEVVSVGEDMEEGDDSDVEDFEEKEF